MEIFQRFSGQHIWSLCFWGITTVFLVLSLIWGFIASFSRLMAAQAQVNRLMERLRKRRNSRTRVMDADAFEDAAGPVDCYDPYFVFPHGTTASSSPPGKPPLTTGFQPPAGR